MPSGQPSPAQVALQKDEAGRRPILDRVQNRVDFHEYRERALVAPDLARDQLAEFAVLRIKVCEAKDLIAADPNYHRVWAKEKASSDPYVIVLVEDTEYARTDTQKVTTNPTWNSTLEVKVHTARDVVQLMVMDEDMVSSDDLLGFVEFSVADLPLGMMVKGWFSLTSKDKLQSTARKRLAKAMKGMDLDMMDKAGEVTHKTDSGSVLLELCLDIISKDRTDEFYAFCLPERPQKMYPVTGYRRDLEPLDAQAVYDSVNHLVASLTEGVLFPCMAFFEYVATWREPWLSLVCTASATFVALWPVYILPMWFLVQGVFMLSFSSPSRRKLMFHSPQSVPINDEGYELVARMNSSDKMAKFLERVIAVMHGKVTNKDLFQDFAAFAAEDGKPVTDYRDLKAQLRQAAKASKPFVTFPDKPMQKGTLVSCESMLGRAGEVVECIDPKSDPRTYLVAFGTGKHEEKIECKGDDLEMRLDLRWVSNKTVRALIPDGVEDSIMSVQPTIDSVGKQIDLMLQQVHTIVAWETKRSAQVTAGIFGAFIVFMWVVHMENSILGTLVLWLLKIVVALVVIFLHVFFASFAVKVRTKLSAEALVKQHAAKDPTTWPFFTPLGAPPVSQPSLT